MAQIRLFQADLFKLELRLFEIFGVTLNRPTDEQVHKENGTQRSGRRMPGVLEKYDGYRDNKAKLAKLFKIEAYIFLHGYLLHNLTNA